MRDKKKYHIQPGDIYEDCAYHPCLCTEVEDEGDDISVSGISLIDGSYPRPCSLNHCGVIKMTLEEAWHRKREFAEGVLKYQTKTKNSLIFLFSALLIFWRQIHARLKHQRV